MATYAERTLKLKSGTVSSKSGRVISIIAVYSVLC